MKVGVKKIVSHILFGFSVCLGITGCKDPAGQASSEPQAKASPANVTFNHDIAPLIYQQCSPCHRPGQSGPFPLLTYVDVKKRAKQIAEVTKNRVMPPWLPEPGYAHFEHERRLSDAQIQMISNWVKQGVKEGNPADLPPEPRWAEGWQLGKPDLVVKMAEPYTLPAAGKDVYRNFVIPIPINETKYVSGVEFRPNSRIVHHAFMLIDRTTDSRREDEKDPGPGFGGMDFPENAHSPDGHFLSWQPGKVPSKEPEGMAWTLEKGSDLVLQVHMQPNGKPEKLQASIGFYFTPQPPTQKPFKIGLGSYDIDIPPGKRDYTIMDTYKLPVDVQVMAALPHAHYLGKRLEGYATLPDGTKRTLLLIKDWNFNWQGDYKYAEPIFVPKDSVLTMAYTYDNSAANVRNPNHPPKRVRYGPNTTDEMGELWLQLLPMSAEDYKALSQDYSVKALRDIAAYNVYRLRIHPNDPKAHLHLGKGLMLQGRYEEALPHLQAALKADPTYDEAYYNMGLVYRHQNQPEKAIPAFEQALRYNPQHEKAHGNLGLIYEEQGQLDQAEQHFQAALTLDPNDTLAKESLEEIRRARGR